MKFSKEFTALINGVIDIFFRRIALTVLFIIVFTFLFTFIANTFKIGFDSTDGESRSGMKIYIDNMTGCEYLGSQTGGLTPRLDKNSNHICNE